MEDHLIIGIDPSFTRTGFAVINLKKDIIYADSYTSKRRKDYGKVIGTSQRIDKIITNIKEGIALATVGGASISAVGIEAPSYGKFTNSSMAETGGLFYTIVRSLVHQFGVEAILPLRPKSVKLIATNDGSASKEEIKKKMGKRYKKGTFKNYDESDAAAVAFATLLCMNYVSKTVGKAINARIINAIKKVFDE